jgi:hypothetical protein
MALKGHPGPLNSWFTVPRAVVVQVSAKVIVSPAGRSTSAVASVAPAAARAGTIVLVHGGEEYGRKMGIRKGRDGGPRASSNNFETM